MMRDVRGATPARDVFTVGSLFVAGQAIIQLLGHLAPALVRYPGPWRPTLAVDSHAYLDAAAQLPTFEPYSTTKLAFLVLLRVDQVLGLAGWGVLAVNSLSLVLAGWLLLRYIEPRWGRRAGLLSVAALVLNPHVTQWTKTLLTEPLFMPLVVAVVVLLAASSSRMRVGPVALGAAALTVLVRPNGIGVLLGASAILAARLPRARVASFAAILALLAAIVASTPAFQSPGGEGNTLADRTYEGLVVWAHPYDVTIPMPAPSDPSDVSNRALIRYAVEHPLAIAELGSRRVLAELTQVRAHYPRAANVLIGLQMLVFATLAGAGALRARRDPITASVVAVSVGLLLTIAGTWAIAEGRFGWSMFVAWSPWVGIGADRLLRSLRPSGAGP